MDSKGASKLMRHLPIDKSLFIENRKRLTALLPPQSLAVVNANDILPTNADGVLPLVPNADLFYLTGIEQEQSILVLAPDAFDPTQREILFIRDFSEEAKTWEGDKQTLQSAAAISGIATVKFLSEFPRVFHSLMCEMDVIVLNSNEHKRAVVEVETRDARFVRDVQRQYPLHRYERLTKFMHRLRMVKAQAEIELMRTAIDVTARGFARILQFVKPGVGEHEVEAEFAHEFIRNRSTFAYTPIVASGANACVLHYIANDQPCRDGDLLLLDVGARYANYCADLTRTIPVNGVFTPRQRQIYDAVLRVLRQSIRNATIGKLHRDWTLEAQRHMNDELLAIGLLTANDIAGQTEANLACRRYFMHGLGHPLGLDVHDLGYINEPMADGWVLTVEPGVYIPQEGIGIRLENNILLTDSGPVDLMANIPLEAAEIEDLMHRRAN